MISLHRSLRTHRATLAGPAKLGALVRGQNPPRRVSLPVARAASDSEAAKLTELIMDAEGKLAALFEPGKPMPKAGVVAAMREQISVLKTELTLLVSGAADPSTSTSSQTAEEAAEKARQAFLEIERSLEIKYRRNTRVDDSAQIAMLEAENERLRYEAQALLSRQQQLEDVLQSARLLPDKSVINSAVASSAAAEFVGASLISEMERIVQQEEAEQSGDSAPRRRYIKWR